MKTGMWVETVAVVGCLNAQGQGSIIRITAEKRERKRKKEGRGVERRDRRPTGEDRLSRDIWKQVGSEEHGSLCISSLAGRHHHGS